MSTNVQKEITLVTDIVSFAVSREAINATTSNTDIDQYFKIQAWVNAIASPACKSWSYLANTVTEEGVPVLIMLSPKNPAATNTFKRLYDELAEMIIVNVPLMTFTLETNVTCYNPAVILSQLPAYKPEFATYIDAMASLVLMANIPGAFYIETVTDGAYLHLPNHQKADAWSNDTDELVVECYSARNLKNHQSSRILLSSKNVAAIAYVPEKQLMFLRNTPKLFDHVGNGGIDLPILYSPHYLDAKVPGMIRKQKGEMVHVPTIQTADLSQPHEVCDTCSEIPLPKHSVLVWNSKTSAPETVAIPDGVSPDDYLKQFPHLRTGTPLILKNLNQGN